MNNKTVLHLCIADVNELLTHALREHVLRSSEYEVAEVTWVQHESYFQITLEPKKAEALPSHD